MDPVKVYNLDETTRVVVEVDEYAEKPDWGSEGDFPVFTIEYLGWYRCVPQNTAANDYEDYINAALSQWGRDYDMIERYLKAFHGATELYWHSTYNGNIFIFDPQEAVEVRFMGEDVSVERRGKALSDDLSAWDAWVSGEVYTLSVERLRTGRVVYDDGSSDEHWEEWEPVEDGITGGYYGDDTITDNALAEFAADVL